MKRKPHKGKKPNVNELVNSMVDQTTNDQPEPKPHYGDKNPTAFELGRKGGLKDGKARAKKLTAEWRREIARNAAYARKRNPS